MIYLSSLLPHVNFYPLGVNLTLFKKAWTSDNNNRVILVIWTQITSIYFNVYDITFILKDFSKTNLMINFWSFL